jgi:flap endonuclease-1
MGIPLLLTSNSVPEEAESLCSSLVLANRADAVLSEDTDVLVYQAPLLRHVNSTSREGERIDGADVRKALRFNDKQWVDFCILLGCDFAERLKGYATSLSQSIRS